MHSSKLRPRERRLMRHLIIFFSLTVQYSFRIGRSDAWNFQRGNVLKRRVLLYFHSLWQRAGRLSDKLTTCSALLQ